MSSRKEKSGFSEKGSQRDIQLLLNNPDNVAMLEGKLGTRIVEVLSPIAVENFREYRDAKFLEKIGLPKCAEQLRKEFWPSRGPVWDGIAKTEDGTFLLFESKAHISELFGCGMKAKDKASRDLIQKSLNDTAEYVRAKYDVNAWTDVMYQTANRLAYAYFINHKIAHAGTRVKIVYLIFLNDDSVATKEETKDKWDSAIEVSERYILKLPSGRGSRFADGKGMWKDWVEHVFIDIKKEMKI